MFPNQAQFHPLKYLAGLEKAVLASGGKIYTGTHIDKTEGGKKAKVTTSKGFTVTAEHIVVATNTPINNMVVMHTKQAPYRSYAIGARIPKDSVGKGLYWDTLDPYHYIRIYSEPAKDGREPVTDILIVGGEDHKTGQSDDESASFF